MSTARALVRHRRRSFAAVLVAAVLVAVASACGGSEPSASTGSGSAPDGGSVATGTARDQPGTTATRGTATGPAASWRPAFVEQGGATVVVACRGEGGPTVLLLAPLATASSDAWVRTSVPDALAGQTKVCVYDRPGLGQSAAGLGPVSVAAEAARLDAVVDQVGDGAPVVVVAEGYSTYIARQLAKDQRAEVAGLVLIDPPLWTSGQAAPPGATPGERAEYDSLEAVDADIGSYGSATLPLPPVSVLVLGVDASLPARPPLGGPQVLTDAAAAGSTTTTSIPEPSTEGRHLAQRELATTSPFGRFQAVDGAGSELQLWKPEVVTESITKVLAGARAKR